MDDHGPVLQTLVPLLQVNDILETISYYQENLGFSLSFLWPNEDDPKWAGVARDGAGFMFTIDLGASHGRWLAEKGNGVVLYVIVNDADALFQELSARGALVVQDPVTYGERRQFSVADPSGYVIAFSEPFAG